MRIRRDRLSDPLARAGVDPPSHCWGVIDLDAEVADGALKLGVAEESLGGLPTAGTATDQGRFGAPIRVRVILARMGPNHGRRAIDEAGVLARAHRAAVGLSAGIQGNADARAHGPDPC